MAQNESIANCENERRSSVWRDVERSSNGRRKYKTEQKFHHSMMIIVTLRLSRMGIKTNMQKTCVRIFLRAFLYIERKGHANLKPISKQKIRPFLLTLQT